MSAAPTRAPSIQRKPTARLLLVMPPLVLLAASGLLMITSPFAWGAAEVLDAPDWMPPVLGIIVAIGGLSVGFFSLRHTLRTTHGDFEVFGLQLVFGVLMFVSGAAMMLSLVFQLPDTDTYARALDDNGEYTVSVSGFFILSLLLGAFNVGWVWVGAYLYSHAIANMQPNRISARHPGETDGVGELLRERR